MELIKINNSNHYSFLLFDDDCGICTKFSKTIGVILRKKLIVVPMHNKIIEDIGIRNIGQSYWQSFHIVKNKVWSTQNNAITALAGLFPFGNYVQQVTLFPPIKYLLEQLLVFFQKTRKKECSIMS